VVIKIIMRLAAVVLVAVALLAGLPGYWPIVAGLGGAVLFVMAGGPG